MKTHSLDCNLPESANFGTEIVCEEKIFGEFSLNEIKDYTQSQIKEVNYLAGDKYADNPEGKLILHSIKNNITAINSSVMLYEDYSYITNDTIIAIKNARNNIDGLYSKLAQLSAQNVENGGYLFSNLYKENDIKMYMGLFCKQENTPKKIEVNIKNDLNDDKNIHTFLAIDDYKRIMENLFKNAAEATDKDKCHIKFLLKNIFIPEEKRGYLLLQFQDNGCGIDKCNLEKIFINNFSTKEDNLCKNLGRGHGLLEIKKLVNNAKGVIWVNSTKGIGTCFTILLPTITQIE